MAGQPLCVDHAEAMSRINEANNDTLRLLMADMANMENSVYASFGLPPRRHIIPPRQVVHAPQTTINDHSVKIDRSTIGVLNTGAIDTLNASVTLIGQTNPEHAEQINTLVETISRNQELDQEAKKETIEQISYLLGQISVPTQDRNSSVLKSIFASIGITLSTSADLLTLWDSLKPILKTYLPS